MAEAQNGAGDDLLFRAAERGANHSFFLAATLRAYADLEALDDDGLAARLGCHRGDLPALALCRRPETGDAFAMDVQRIAGRFGVDAARLAEIVRLVDALGALGKGAAERSSEARLLAAARDREEDGAGPDKEDL